MHLTRIRPVFEASGPFVTVHADVTRATEDARQRLDAKATAIRQELEGQGVGKRLVDAIIERLTENHHLAGEARLTIVGSGDEILFADVQQGHASAPETWEVAPLPDLSGWLQGQDGVIRFGLVVVDREGADIDFYAAADRGPVAHEQVTGETFGITKVSAGGWAMKKFQQSAENAWKANAREVADSVLQGIRQHKPRVVVLAGDERMRTEVNDALETAPTDVVHTEAGGRGAGASQEALDRAVDEILARYIAEAEQDLVEELMEGTGRGTGVARGLQPVVDAFVKGQVRTLVLDLDAAGAMTVRPAEHPGLLVPPTVGDDSVPADRVLTTAATLTDAELVLLPSSQTMGQGVAALLRWDDSAGPSD